METSCPLDRIAENAFQVSPFYWDDELMETNLLIKIKVDSSPGSPFYWDDELMETLAALSSLARLEYIVMSPFYWDDELMETGGFNPTTPRH